MYNDMYPAMKKGTLVLEKYCGVGWGDGIKILALTPLGGCGGGGLRKRSQSHQV